jgi:bifunctional NMN adenylyltransferase/nudix hydrolase
MAMKDKLVLFAQALTQGNFKEINMYDLLVFIGRFQPFHNEHKSVIDFAFTQAKNVLVLVGSSFRARTPKNPFTYEERSDMILQSYPEGTNLYTDAIRDYPYDDSMWAEQVRKSIRFIALDIVNAGGFHNHGTNDLRIGIIGTRKDDSSYYLDMFPEYDLVEAPLNKAMNATDIRESIFRDLIIPVECIPASTEAVLDSLPDGFYEYISYWQEAIDDNADLWITAPYPVKQVTVDAVVHYRGQILLVERGAHPGLGLLALPGGHLNVGERTLAGAIRELTEETCINVDHLEKYVVNSFVADDPARSTMGHTISHCFLFDLSELPECPVVQGADDAVYAIWVDIEDIQEELMFDDHYHIMSELL